MADRIPAEFTIKHCTPSVKAAVAVIRVENGEDRDKVLKEISLSVNPFYQALKIRQHCPALFAKVMAGDMAVSKAEQMLRYGAAA